MNRHRTALAFVALTSSLGLLGQQSLPVPPKLPGAVRHLYKQTASRPLYLYSLAPTGFDPPRPAIVFFFGGGWVSGTLDQFDDQASHFAGRGLVSILVDYRVKSRDQSTPFDSVRDARSAMRWIRSHAAELRIDPAKIVAAGGSAGGHLAGATAILKGLDDASDDLSVSPVPNALVLFNPVLDTTESGYGAALIGKDTIQLSLTEHVKPGLPPMILLHGTSDHTVPFSNAEEFVRRVKAAGGQCQLVPFKDADHGFFNSPSFRKGASEALYRKGVADVDGFLLNLGLE
jgi:acetyl esterase/lipase